MHGLPSAMVEKQILPHMLAIALESISQDTQVVMVEVPKVPSFAVAAYAPAPMKFVLKMAASVLLEVRLVTWELPS